MIRFEFLNKQEKELWLPELFDLLYDNMRHIVPNLMPYEQEKAQWLENVSPALEKAPRQILMCFVDDALAGYIQYYVRDQLLMVEEVQIEGKYHSTLVFYRLCEHFWTLVPADVLWIEAYAEKPNRRSQQLMRKLGMVQTEEEEASPFVHFRGEMAVVKKRFER